VTLRPFFVAFTATVGRYAVNLSAALREYASRRAATPWLVKQYNILTFGSRGIGRQEFNQLFGETEGDPFAKSSVHLRTSQTIAHVAPVL
jgi:hypothetical protein